MDSMGGIDPSKRYHLFQYDQYYPGGAESDYTGSFPSIEDAKNCLRAQYHRIGKFSEHMGNRDNWDILDGWTGEWHS
jgi:hypothetical protein